MLLLPTGVCQVLMMGVAAAAKVPIITWLPATQPTCIETCKAYDAQPATQLTSLSASPSSKTSICAVYAAGWTPGYKEQSSPGCHYFNTATKAPAVQQTGYHCACVTANGPSSIIQWLPNDKDKECKSGFERFLSGNNNICRFSTTRAPAFLVGFQGPALAGTTPKCLTGGGEATSFDYLCIKSGTVVCSGTPASVADANDWPSTCAQATPGSVCNSSCKAGFYYITNGSATTTATTFTSQCQPDGHWVVVPGVCKQQQTQAGRLQCASAVA